MTFDGLERTPQVAPLLVRLYDTHNLYALAENKGSDEACMELATVMVDLLSVRLSDRESELITDVLLGLMKQAQKDLKTALSQRLSAMEDIPLRIVLGLANDDISIAEPVLINSPVLHDVDLIYILQAKGVGHGRTIAKRKGIGSDLINMLADTKDFQIAVNLSNNDGVVLTEHAYSLFADMAKFSEELASPLLSREDLPQEIAGKLYQFVSDELKKVLKKRYGIGAARVAAVLDDITVELVDARPHSETNHEKLLTYAHNLDKRGELKVHVMIDVLRRGQYPTFLAMASVFFGVSLTKMRAALIEPTGRGLAIACKAKELQKSEFVSLYLLTEKVRSGVRRVVSQKELSHIMTMYDEIKHEFAKHALEETHH